MNIGSGRRRTPAPLRRLLGLLACALLAPACGGGSSGGAPAPAPPPFSPVEPGVFPLTDSAMAFGDYDGDGDLDLVLSGTTFSINPATRLLRNDAGAFTEVASSLPASGYAQAAVTLCWGDYDLDGDLDLLLSGTTSTGQVTRIYRNDAGAFTDIAAGLPTLGTNNYSTHAAWGDFDNDGDLDLALGGLNLATPINRIYRNDAGTFVDVAAPLTGSDNPCVTWADLDNDGDLDLLYHLGFGWAFGRNDAGTFVEVMAPVLQATSNLAGGPSAAWADYDLDGDLDLALAGFDGTSSFTKIYRNDAGALSLLPLALPGVGTVGIRPSIEWGDMDGDGDPDLVISGPYPGAPPLTPSWTYLCRNDGGDVFSAVDIDVPGAGESMHAGSLALGDVDNDGDLDLMIAPYNLPLRLYLNTSAAPNTPPTAPTGLSSTPSGGQVQLQWSPSTDTQTASAGLSYSLRVGSTPGSGNRYASLSDLSTDRRRIPAAGPLRSLPGPAVTLKLPAGTYYWSVQAVDPGHAGSAWAAEQSFTIP